MRKLLCWWILASPAMAADLQQTLSSLIDTNEIVAQARVGLHVIDLKTGAVVYARNESRFFMPASNMKLFTTALALIKLGPAYRFETRLVREPSGDLVLVGSGDPSLSGRAYPYRAGAPAEDPLLAIDNLAQQAVDGGLKRVTGDIAGDDSLYPWFPYPDNWTASDTTTGEGAPVSALSIADNMVTIALDPGANPGDLARLSLSPKLEYFSIDNRLVTAAGDGDPQVQVTRIQGTRQLLIAGIIHLHGPRRAVQVPVDDPALYAASALYQALIERGVSISGRAVARHRSAADPFVNVAGTVLASRTSPPVSQLVQMTDKVNQTLHAELLLREMARVQYRTGSVENGALLLNSFLAQMGAQPGDDRIDDGSGLSRFALVSPRTVTRLLSRMFNSNLKDAWMSMLPVGGGDGTLARRLCCSTEAASVRAAAAGSSRAIVLSGYVLNKTRGWLAFSVLVNNFAAPAAEVQAWMDRLVLAMAE